MDPQTRAYLAQSLMQRPRRQTQNPWGNAFSGIAQILAQRNLGKANQEILRGQELDEETERNRRALGYIGLEMDPQMAEYMADAPPEIQKALMQRHMEQQSQASPEQIMSIYPDVTLEQAQAFVNLPPNMQQQVGAMFISQNEPEKPKGAPRYRVGFDEQGQKFREKILGVDESGKTIVGEREITALAKSTKESPAERLARLQAEDIEAARSRPTKTSTTSFQKELAAIHKQRESLKRIDMQVAMDHLSRQGKLSDMIATELDNWKLGDQTLPWEDKPIKEQLNELQKFLNTSGQLFADYRRLVTGAAASMPELARLEEIFLNPRMSRSRFQGAYEQLMESLESDATRIQGYLLENMSLEEARAKVVGEGGGVYGQDSDQFWNNIQMRLLGEEGDQEGEDLGLERP